MTNNARIIKTRATYGSYSTYTRNKNPNKNSSSNKNMLLALLLISTINFVSLYLLVNCRPHHTNVPDEQKISHKHQHAGQFNPELPSPELLPYRSSPLEGIRIGEALKPGPPQQTRNSTQTRVLLKDLDDNLRPIGTSCATRGFGSSIYVNTGGGLDPFTKASRQPEPLSRISRFARLIKRRAADKILMSETHITVDKAKEIREYLDTFYPEVKLVMVPMNETTKQAINEERKEKDPTSGFSGVGALLHVSWFDRLINKAPVNSCAGRALELIFSEDGTTASPILQVDLIVYAVSGSKAARADL